MKIYELNFSARTYNTLTRAGIMDVEQLQEMPEEDLKKIRGMSQKSIEEIKEKLSYHGLSLAEEEEIEF